MLAFYFNYIYIYNNLANNKFFPFRKPNNKPLYINTNSNHPTTIIKQLPKMINKRISELSCNKDEFNKAKLTYESALKESGYTTTMTYEKEQKNKNRKRKRKVIWFNPPYSQSIKTNVGKIFIRLIKKHFPRHHRFYKIFNINTLKLSYCCTTNMADIIKQHNSKVLNEKNDNEGVQCNCRKKENCPMEGMCLAKCIIYKAEVSTENETFVYFGASEGEFKTRYNNHTKLFKHRRYENDSELSKCLWKLKDKKTAYSLKWSIAARASKYKCGTRRCDLCLTEKAIIVRSEHRRRAYTKELN